jgi:hypothetical protein
MIVLLKLNNPNKERSLYMGVISRLRIGVRFDRWGRVILMEGQRWVEKKSPTTVWTIGCIEDLRLDDEEKKIVHLISSDDCECESAYTEKFFRKWFYEINQPQRKKNMARVAKPAIQSFKHLLTTGVVVGKK